MFIFFILLVSPALYFCATQVPNLYKPDEFEEVRNALSDEAKKLGIDDTPLAIFQFLLDRVRSNLHIVLGMSPVGEAFRSATAAATRSQKAASIRPFAQILQGS